MNGQISEEVERTTSNYCVICTNIPQFVKRYVIYGRGTLIFQWIKATFFSVLNGFNTLLGRCILPEMGRTLPVASIDKSTSFMSLLSNVISMQNAHLFCAILE